MSEKEEIHSGSWVKKISKNGKWYLLTSIFTKGAALVLLPIYVSYLTKEEIGVFTTLTSIGMYLPIFISFALESSFYKFFH
ncbi:MAG: hypothetical protein H7321_02380, partial [Bacteroidia bacterium]|nr:hypothetical protein [Bacteroidia bacterium]